MENARPSFLSFRFDGFSLKIAALSFMTLDHIGAFIEMNYLPVEGTPLSVAATVLRAIGRLAFPLFVFFLAEGMRYTHDRGNYCLRFAILAAFILICQAGLGQIPGFGYLLSDLSQPFIDLLLLALIAFFYESFPERKCNKVYGGCNSGSKDNLFSFPRIDKASRRFPRLFI